MRETAEGVKTKGARVGIGREIFFTARTVALIELKGGGGRRGRWRGRRGVEEGRREGNRGWKERRKWGGRK